MTAALAATEMDARLRRSAMPHRAAPDPSSMYRSARRSSSTPVDAVEDALGHGRSKRQSTMRDSNHAPREGRQFRVGNMGNNGLLYLRPVGSQRKTDASKTSSHGSNAGPAQDPPAADLGWRDSTHSGTGTFQSTSSRNSVVDVGERSANPGHGHGDRKRSHSFSHPKDSMVHIGPAPGAIKVIVDRASIRQANPSSTKAPHLLEVQIPHYRLGRPQFGRTGSAAIHSSLYSSEAEQSHSPGPSRFAYEGSRRGLEFLEASSGSSYHSWNSERLTLNPIQRRTISSELLPLGPAQSSGTGQKSALLYSHSSRQEQNALMRVSPTGQLTAATPSILINQITSPTNLDYDLLSDFFLTFRFYTTATSVLSSLLSRLSSAMSSTEECGRVVRVRTFVALRHWVLNYFIDDFVPDYGLRARLCGAVNNITHELTGRRDGGGGDLNIMGELKKCWRRTCSLYWDVPEHRLEGPEDDIMPGGKIGSRSSSIGEGIDNVTGAHQNLATLPSEVVVTESPWIIPTGPDAPPAKPVKIQPAQDQRGSIQSMHIVSCSIPVPHRFKAPPSSFGPRPVPHRRSGSFSDALRDDRAPLPVPRPALHDVPAPFTQPIPGSIIRGAVFQPTRPNVDALAPSSPSEELASFDYHRKDSDDGQLADEQVKNGTNPAVKKLLGSMRRALSARQPRSQSVSRTSPERLQRRMSNGMPGRSIRTPSPRGVAKRKLVAGRTLPRMDLLSLRVADSFERAVWEEVEAQHAEAAQVQAQSAARRGLASTQPPDSVPSGAGDARGHSNVTMGSRSIVIVDDTGEKTPTLPKFGSMSHSHVSSASADSRLQPAPLALQLARTQGALGEVHGALIAPSEEQDEATPRASHFVRPSETTLGESDGHESIDHNLAVATEHRSKTQYTENVTEKNVQDGFPNGHPRPGFAGQRGAPADSSLAHVPKHTLRRRPGGDLRAVDHVHDLQEDSRADSLGSFQDETATESPTPRRAVTQKTHTHVPSTQATSVPRRSISMVDTHSSQPNMRPSFEKEVAKLAQLPDNPDDGGIESALQKLEGRFSESQDTVWGPTSSRAGGDEFDLSVGPHEAEALSLRSEQLGRAAPAVDHISVDDEPRANISNQEGSVSNYQTPTGPLDQSHTVGFRATALSITPSEMSDSSADIAEVGAGRLRRQRSNSSSDWLEVSLPRSQDSNIPASRPNEHGTLGTANNSDQSLEVVERTESIRRIVPGATMPPPSPQPHESFLLDDNQSLSGLSGEDGGESHGMKSFFDGDVAPAERNTARTQTVRGGATASNSVKNNAFVPVVPTASQQHESYEQDRYPFRRSRSKDALHQDPNSKAAPTKSKSAQELRGPHITARSPPPAAHLPFILAHKSSVLAQQFTLIEKDALCEIDWRELIEMRWKQTACPIRNWVEFLKSNRGVSGKPLCNGVDLCIARFNLVVRWAVSEIVLTQDLNERVACIVKYIHLAQHARQLRNWATMYQISTALVSAECSRLKRTWSHVPEREREALKALESLIMPMRNFHNLRTEMEVALSADADTETNGACIPFIGIYTHDLMYNAQKPPFISGFDGRDGGEPLVNFERHHTAATIAKSLLQMLEASTRYSFQPVPEVISRCLWLAALPDEEISRKSHQLEP